MFLIVKRHSWPCGFVSNVSQLRLLSTACADIATKLGKIQRAEKSYQIQSEKASIPLDDWVNFFKQKNKGSAVRTEIKLKEQEIQQNKDIYSSELLANEEQQLTVMKTKLSLMRNLQDQYQLPPFDVTSFCSSLMTITGVARQQKQLQVKALEIKVKDATDPSQKYSFGLSKLSEEAQVSVLTMIQQIYGNIAQASPSSDVDATKGFCDVCLNQVVLMKLREGNLLRLRSSLNCPTEDDEV
jgi:hypothetical protein